MLTQPLTQLIEAYTGLHLRSQHSAMLWQKLQARMKALKFTTPEQYYHYLSDRIDAGGAIQFNPEWQAVIQLLLTGESYFLRDQGQFRLLQQHLLPALIQARRQQATIHHTKPSLRIWSAGCSTGEEAYSLAILVQQLMPDWCHWDLLILGTDINHEAITHARNGIYQTWSFRMMSTEARSKHFHADQGRWRLDATIRSMVTFHLGNLVQDHFPHVGTDLCEMDLIVCRNVFIYFAPETIAAIADKFSQTLRPGGYLMTGHTELHGQNLGGLSVQVFPESIIYHKAPTPPEASIAPRPPIVSSTRKSEQDHLVAVLDDRHGDHNQEAVAPSKQLSHDFSDPDGQPLKAAEQYFQQGDYPNAIAIAEAAIDQAAQPFEFHYLIAQSYISLKAYDQAKEHAQQMVNIDALSTVPYYLLAYIARQQEEWERAKELLKRIIYLDSAAISAYLELSDLYTQEGNTIKAKKMQTTARTLIQQ